MYEPKAKLVPAGRLEMVAVRSMNRDNPSHSVLKYNSSNSKLTARLNELYTMSSTLLAREIDHVEWVWIYNISCYVASFDLDFYSTYDRIYREFICQL